MMPIRLPVALVLLAAAPLVCAVPPGVSGPGTGPAPTADPALTPPVTVQPGTASAAAAQTQPAPATRPAPVFEGLTWQLAAYRSGASLAEVQEGRGPARFHFDQGRLAGSAGCNRLLGAYTLDGERIRFEPKMAATMMACPEPLMAQDQAVGAAFAAAARVRREGDLLELLDAADQPVLRLIYVTPAPLVGPLWQLKGYNNGKQAIVSLLAGTEVTLELRDDGTLGGFDGCNRFMSGYTLEKDRISIGPLATTRMACKGPEGAGAQAAGFAAALGRVAGFKLEGAELTLVDGEGKPAARFQAAGGPVGAATGQARDAAASVQPR